MQQGTREIVVPGDVLDDSGRLRPGANTIKEGGTIYAARLGVKSVRGDTVQVVSLSGRYDPQRGDMVIGTVIETGPSNWYINVGASGDVGMHVNDVPWRVEFGETAKYLNTGDTVLLKVFHVDELKKVQVTMKDRQARKLTGGIIVEVSPAKVPRIVGRNGSMIATIKNMTNTRMFVGQNGIIWLDGDAKDVSLAIQAIRMIEEQAHLTGLTDKVRAFLEANGGVWREGGGDSEDDGGAFVPEADKPRTREWREGSGWEAPAEPEGGRPARRPREDRHGRSFDERRGGGRGGAREGRGRGEGAFSDRRGGDRRGGGGFGGDRRGGFERREGGDRPRFEERPPRAEGAPRRFEDRPPRAEGERPRFEDRPPREDRPRRFGETDDRRGGRADGASSPEDRAPRDARPPRVDEDRPRREDRGERPRRFGERDDAPRDAPRRDERPRRFEDAPPRAPRDDDRPPRRDDRGDRPPRRFDDAPPRPRDDFTDRPRREGGDRPRRDEGGDRPRRDAPERGRGRDDAFERGRGRPEGGFGRRDERPPRDDDAPRGRRSGGDEPAERPEPRARRFGAPDDEDDRPAPPKGPSRRFGAADDEPAEDLSTSSGRFGGDESGERRGGGEGGRRRRRGGRGRRRGGGDQQ